MLTNKTVPKKLSKKIWGNENPRQVQQNEIHQQRTPVWCDLSARGVIGLFFFENDRDNAVTVNGESYPDMITNFL